VSDFKALIAVWRNIVEGRASDTPWYEDGLHPSGNAQVRDGLRTQAEALMRTFLPRLPEHLHLGQPENTQYAVLRRAVERLERNNDHGAAWPVDQRAAVAVALSDQS